MEARRAREALQLVAAAVKEVAEKKDSISTKLTVRTGSSSVRMIHLLCVYDASVHVCLSVHLRLSVCVPCVCAVALRAWSVLARRSSRAGCPNNSGQRTDGSAVWAAVVHT